MTRPCKHCGSKPVVENQRENVWVAYCTFNECPNPPFFTGASERDVRDRWDVANRVEDDPLQARALDWLRLNKQLAEWADAPTEQQSLIEWIIEKISP